MTLLAASLIASTTIVAKYLGTLGTPLHPFQVSAGRFVFAFLALLVFSAMTRPGISNPKVALHLGRSLFGWMGVTLMFTAVAHIPVSDATAISFLNPVFGMMLAIPILGEKVGKWRWSAAGIALCGAVVLLRPGAGSFQPAALFALLAALFMGLEVVLIKLLSGREPPMQILLFNNGIGATLALTAALFVWTSPTWDQWIGLCLIGLLMVCGQALFIQAMRSAEASFVLPFSYSTLVFATVYDFWAFGAQPDAISITGATVILGGAALLAWREMRIKT
ncbi:MAG: DMT family transporter [Rhodobacteraceae bacterium]|nr:DMT family transporter [Paracoccaceae bacterium]